MTTPRLWRRIRHHRTSVSDVSNGEMTLKSMFTPKTRLPDALRLGMKKSAFEKTPYTFLPQSALDSIITEDTILMALGIATPTPEDCKLVAYILTKAKRLFATAAYVGLLSDTLYYAMVLFRNANFSDEGLPLEEMGAEDFLKNKMSGLKHPLVKLEGHVKPNVERIWTFSRIDDFLKAQFSFLAPIFSTEKTDYDFGPSIILPFMEHTAQGEGSFGVVSRVEIHPDHVMSTEAIHTKFAVKQIKASHDLQEVAERWKSEVRALSAMNELKQDHIIRFIAAFHRGRPEAREHYLMFEWADGGNLHELWQSEPSQPLTGTLVHETITQLHGLANALSAAHYLESDRACARSYRHGDLKPENILRFDTGTAIGKLKIGDWGEAKLHQTATAMRKSTTARYGTRRYEPPECEVGIGPTDFSQRAKGRSRLYDIWSMGCITLEFIVWLLYGATELRKFNDSVTTDSGDQSPFYEVNEAYGVRSIRVHSTVASWMEHMSKDPACRAGKTALGDLLEVVKCGLLVVNLPSHGGSKDLLVFDDVQTERSTDMVFPDLTSRPKDWLPQVKFEGMPMIKVTRPDEVHPNKADGLIIRSGPIIEHPVRYRADELCARLKQIESRHAEGSYRFMPRELPLPGAILARCSTRITRGDNERRSQLIRDYGVQTKANIRVHRRSSVKVDYAHPAIISEDQARVVKHDGDEACFTTRGRTRGSKNKRTEQQTRDSTKTVNSTSSRSQRSNPKRPRIDRDDDDDQGERDDNEESPHRKNPKDPLPACNLVCPFARHRPVEYPQCRTKQYRDIAKVKEHLRERHQRHCARCGEAFHTENAKNEHLRQDDVCTRKSVALVESSLTFMNKEQEASISNEHGLSWFRMYEILFPGAVPGDSFWKSSEWEVLVLISRAHGTESITEELYQIYEQNKLSESTCSARAALHSDQTTTFTQSRGFRTIDSGYSAPEECSATGSSALRAEHHSPRSQGQDASTDAAVHVPASVQMPDAGTAEERELQGVVAHTTATEGLGIQTTSSNFEGFTGGLLVFNSPTDETRITPVEEQPEDITDNPSGTLDPRLLSLDASGASDWRGFEGPQGVSQ